jgi:hypothetical protein
MGRSSGAGPWRSVIMMRPPGFRSVTSLRIARAIFRADMLPNAAQPDQIKTKAQLVNTD